MSGLVLRAVRLRGFGPFDDLVAFFEPGLNVLVQPNEWGKSSLVAGIEAVLFGFRSVAASAADRAGRRTWLAGRERYRSWYDPPAFDGILVFEKDGQLFQLYREFESARVLLRSRPGDGSLPEEALQPPGGPGSGPEEGRASDRGGWRQLFRGVHRPRGSRTSEAFEEQLEQWVGLRSVELFEQTFCLTQRLPDPDRLDEAVQSLITGAGTAGLARAREWLVGRARELTCRTDELGMTPESGRRARREEELKARIAQLEAQLEQARRQLDRQAPVREELARLAEEVARRKQELRQQEQLAGAVAQWLQHWRERAALLRQLAQLNAAVEQARALAASVEEGSEQLRREAGPVAGWLELPARVEVERQLQELAAARERWALLQQRVQELRAAWQQRQERVAALGAALDREFGEWKNRPDLAGLPGLHQQLVATAARCRALRTQLQELEAALAANDRELQLLVPWAEVGPGASTQVEQRREQARRFLQRWREGRELWQRQQDLRAACLRDWGALERAEPARVAALRRYVERSQELAQRLQEVEDRLGEWEAAWAQLEQEQSRLLKSFSLAAQLEAGAPGTGEGDWLALLEREVQVAAARGRVEELCGRLQRWAADRALHAGRRRRGLGVAAVAAGALAAALVAAALVWGPQAGPALQAGAAAGAAAFGAAALAAGAGWWAARRAAFSLAAQAQRLQGCVAPPARPSWPQGLWPVVEQAREFRRRSEQLRQRRDELARQGITAQSIQAARWMQQKLAQELAELLRPVEDLVRLYGEGLAQALQRWDELRAERQALEGRLALLVAEWTSPAPDGSVPLWQELERQPLPASLTALARCLAAASLARDGVGTTAAGPAGPAQGGDGDTRGPATLGELAAWLENLPESFWDEALASARRYEQLQAERQALAQRLKALAQGLPGHELPAAHEPSPAALLQAVRQQAGVLEQELEELRRRVAPFDEQTDPAQVAARVESCLSLRHNLTLAEQQCQALAGELQSAQQEQQELQGRLQRLQEPLQELLSRAGDDPGRARELWQGWCRRREQLDQERERLRGLLAAFQVVDLQELEARRLAVERSLAEQEGRLAGLEEQYPALPRFRSDPDVAGLEQQLQQARQALEEARQQAAAAEERHGTLMREQLALEAQATLNVAAAEQELQGLRQELAAVQEEVEALGEAYRQLEAAARDYHREFRRQLEEVAGQFFSRFSRKAGRRVELDDQFRVRVVEPDGQAVAPGWLSQGARDQLFLALRLAVAAMVDRQLRLPFILDDPFVHCDGTRLAEIRSSLQELARDGQILLLTHRPELAAWGHPVQVRPGTSLRTA
ncbi:MAG TPA: AAA family ATPase [Limnochordales bacterium]